jgi:cell division protein FtsN
MAKRKTRNKVRRTAGRRKSDYRKPGWVYMLLGLTVGLAVAFVVYVSELKPSRELREQAEEIVEVPAEVVARAEEKLEETIEEALEENAEEPAVTFDFYDMLPNLDVEVFRDEKPVSAPRPVTPAPATSPATAPGIYILQAGSFSKIDDAQRRKAEMALLGVRAAIKRGNANGRTVYRVYTDPMDSTEEVNRVSQRLSQSNIEVLRKRVSD